MRVSIRKQFDYRKAVHFLTLDNWCRKKKLGLYIFTTATLFGFLLQIIFLTLGDPPKEGFTENLSELLFLFSAIFLFISSFSEMAVPLSKKDKRKLFRFTFAAGLLMIVIFGEEISWGQHMFNWNGGDLFQTYNYQRETNLHNFFNPLFQYFYPLLGMGLYLFLCFGWFFANDQRSTLFNLIFPHSSLFILVFFIATSSYKGHNELFEIQFSIFTFLYSLRLLMCLRYPSNKMYFQQQKTVEKVKQLDAVHSK